MHASHSETFKAAHASDQFAKDHAPGSMTLTASRWPVILDLPPEMKSGWPAYLPSKLALALHMTGAVPFDDSDSPELSRGKRMERVGEEILRERGYAILGTQVRVQHKRMNALTNLDALVSLKTPPREEFIVELKVVDERDYRREWESGPPLYPLLQVAAQQSITGGERAQIGAIVLGYKSVDLILHPVERNEDLIAALEHKGQEFLDLIEREPAERLAELLIEEDSPSSYQAWSRIIQLPKGTVARLEHPEAVERAKRLHEARRLKAAYDTIAETETNWFAKNAPLAATIELLDGTVVTRTVVETPEKAIPAHVRHARQHVTLKVKPAGKEPE